MSGPVVRWAEPSSGASAELRELLQSVDSDDPTPGQLAGLEERLGPQLGPPPGPSGPPEAPAPTPSIAPAGSAALGLGAKLGIVAVIGAAVIGGGALLAPPRTDTPVLVPVLTKVTIQRPIKTPEPKTALANPEPPPEATASAPKTAAAEKKDELELLRAAHAALRGGRAAEALALSRKHAAAFPRGALSQEREVIAIEALSRLGQRGGANTRGRRFIAAFPNSSHARRVRAILGMPDAGRTTTAPTSQQENKPAPPTVAFPDPQK